MTNTDETKMNTKTQYNQFDHSCCFSKENPPCGQKIEHLKCCLCEKENPKIESLLKSERKSLAEKVRGAKVTAFDRGRLGTNGNCVGCGKFLDVNKNYSCNCDGINQACEEIAVVIEWGKNKKPPN